MIKKFLVSLPMENIETNEEWRDVPGYQGYYQISSLGRIKSLERQSRNFNGPVILKEKILNPALDSKGYYFLSLSIDNVKRVFRIHQLVMMGFLGHKPDGTSKIVVDHINNISTDNRLENLQLVTQRENLSKDKNNKTSKYTGVCWAKGKKRWRATIQINGKYYNLGYHRNEEDAAQAYLNKLNEIRLHNSV